MKSFFAGIAAALVLAAPNLYAQDHSSQAVPVVYFSMPFGISNTQSEPTYGLKLAQVSKTRNDGINLFNNRRPALMDFQMKGTEMNALSINGINTLQQRLVHHVDGTSSTQNSINWKYVGYGALGIGVLWLWCEEADWDLCGGDHHSDPVVEEIIEE